MSWTCKKQTSVSQESEFISLDAGLRMDGILAVDFMGCGAGVHVYNPRILEIVARRPTYVGLALWFLHHAAWVEGHTGGSRFTPTVHPC